MRGGGVAVRCVAAPLLPVPCCACFACCVCCGFSRGGGVPVRATSARPLLSCFACWSCGGAAEPCFPSGTDGGLPAPFEMAAPAVDSYASCVDEGDSAKGLDCGSLRFAMSMQNCLRSVPVLGLQRHILVRCMRVYVAEDAAQRDDTHGDWVLAEQLAKSAACLRRRPGALPGAHAALRSPARCATSAAPARRPGSAARTMIINFVDFIFAIMFELE